LDGETARTPRRQENALKNLLGVTMFWRFQFLLPESAHSICSLDHYYTGCGAPKYVTNVMGQLRSNTTNFRATAVR
jgi:hypothetical protein